MWGDDGFRSTTRSSRWCAPCAARAAPDGVLSNATTRLEADLADRDIADAFATVVNSSRLGAVKPDAGVLPGRARGGSAFPRATACSSTTGPRTSSVRWTVGMPAVRFTTAARLEATLRRVGLLA